MTTYPKAEIDSTARLLALERAVQARHARTPFEWYEPSHPGHPGRYSNQLGFHRSTHKYRVMVPGNGWG